MEKLDRESESSGAMVSEVASRSRSVSLSHYELRCQGCERTFEDDGFALECPEEHELALLSARYREKRFEPDTGAEGLFRYRRWLPGSRVLTGAGINVTYKSEGLNRILGLRDAWVVFSGYWPEKGATLGTPIFKVLGLFKEGVLIDPRGVGCVSAAVGEPEIERFVDALRTVLRAHASP
jgi:hypothetical protein